MEQNLELLAVADVSRLRLAASLVTLSASLETERALGPVTPYASAGPSLHLARVKVTWLGAPWASTQVRPGLSLRLGAEWRLAFGAPFLELGWSAAAADAGPAGTLEMGGFLFSAGWRLAP